MIAALYIATALGIAWAANRWISPIGRTPRIALLLFPLIFTGHALLIDGLYGPFDLPYETVPLDLTRAEHGFGVAYNGMVSDLYTQIMPYRKAVHDAFARGEWPLWNPYTLSGEPLAAEAQPAAYSPLTWLALLLPVAKSFTFTATLFFFLTALGTFLFARDMGCSDWPALFAGAAYMACSALVFFMLWPLGQCWALLPWVFIGVKRLDRSPYLLLIVLTIVILTGHPESVLHIVFLGAVYALFVLRRSMIVNGIIAGVLALGISAIYLMPFQEATQQTEEFLGRKLMFATAQRGEPWRESLVILSTDLLGELQQRAWKGTLAARVPYTAAVGSIVLSLAIFALWRVRGREKWFLAGVLLFALLEHVHSPLEEVLRHVPLFDIAVNDRFAFAGALMFAVLAALGVERLMRERDVVRFALCGLATLLMIIVVSRSMTSLVWPNRERWGFYRGVADLLMLCIALLIVVVRPKIAAPALIACLLIQRTMQEGGVIPTFSASVGYPHVPIFDAMKNVKEPFRIVGEGMSFIPGSCAFYGLEDVRGYSAMTYLRYGATYNLWCRRLPVFVNIVEDLGRPFLSFLNVRYAITPRFLPLPPYWHEVTRYRNVKLVENERVLPRAFVPEVVHVAAEAQLMEMSMASDFRKESWIEVYGAKPWSAGNGPGEVTALKRAKLGFDLDADMHGNGWIVISESAWRGWRAYIDGRRVRFQYANIAFLGVYVPQGKHHIRLIYWPETFVIGRAISGVSLLGVGVLIFVRRRSATRDTRRQSDPAA